MTLISVSMEKSTSQGHSMNKCWCWLHLKRKPSFCTWQVSPTFYTVTARSGCTLSRSTTSFYHRGTCVSPWKWTRATETASPTSPSSTWVSANPSWRYSLRDYPSSTRCREPYRRLHSSVCVKLTRRIMLSGRSQMIRCCLHLLKLRLSRYITG